MNKTIKYLTENGIKDCFEQAGILVIPASSVEEMHTLISKVKALLKDVGYSKSWRIDPYYYEKRRQIYEGIEE